MTTPALGISGFVGGRLVLTALNPSPFGDSLHDRRLRCDPSLRFRLQSEEYAGSLVQENQGAGFYGRSQQRVSE